MRGNLRQLWPTALLTAILFQGCKGPSPQSDYPNDPLLLSNKPVIGKSDAPQPRLVRNREPRMPQMPADALVSGPTGSEHPLIERFSYSEKRSDSPGLASNEKPSSAGADESCVNVVAHHVNEE
jgi:hypothetical protein